MQIIEKNLSNIKYLNLSKTNITDISFADTEISTIETIKLSETNISDISIENIFKKNKNIKKFDISDCKKISCNSILMISESPHNIHKCKLISDCYLHRNYDEYSNLIECKYYDNSLKKIIVSKKLTKNLKKIRDGCGQIHHYISQ